MRPDAHKKKRSKQYKKKKEGAGTKNTKENIKKDDVTSFKKIPPADNTVDSAKHDYKPIPSVSSGTNDFEERQSSFSKREITSNWEKYDPQEEHETVIGADFDTLMNAPGGVDAYYHLETPEESISIPSIFEIDGVALSKTLETIPFVKKYELNELGIDKDILNALTDSAPAKLTPKESSNINPFAQALGFDFGKTNKETKENKETEFKPTVSEAEAEDIDSSPEKVVIPDMETQQNVESGNTDGILDRDLEDILQLSGQEEDPGAEINRNGSIEPQKCMKEIVEVENLEEWLDSIL